LKDLVTGAAEGALDLTAAERKELWGGDVVGLSPRIRIYRYSKGQFFGQHCTPPCCHVLVPRNSTANTNQMMASTA
jgi:hypothetical protein